MAKSTKKFNPDVTSKASLIGDDYEDYGYKINNAKRHNSRNKSKRKFKDYTEYDDWLHFVCH